MNAFPITSLDEALRSLNRRPGLLIGPAATRAPGELLAALRVAARAKKVDDLLVGLAEDNYGALIDLLRREQPSKAAAFELEAISEIRGLKPAPDISHLAKALWSACISITEDLTFESALRTHLDSVPGTRSVTVIDETRIAPPPRTVPVYKLLGNAALAAPDAALALSEADLLLRQQDWRQILSTLPDFAREAPLFVVGIGSKLPLARQVLGLLASLPHPRPTRLYFLKDDLSLQDPTVASLCRKFETIVVDASLRDFCAQISAKRSQFDVAREAPTEEALSSLDEIVRQHSGVFAVVPPAGTRASMPAMDAPQIVEALFRPAADDWRPYKYGLDVRRTVTDQLLGKVNALAKEAKPGFPRVLLVHGEAGVGKTTTLRRVAMEAAGETSSPCGALDPCQVGRCAPSEQQPNKSLSGTDCPTTATRRSSSSATIRGDFASTCRTWQSRLRGSLRRSRLCTALGTQTLAPPTRTTFAALSPSMTRSKFLMSWTSARSSFSASHSFPLVQFRTLRLRSARWNEFLQGTLRTFFAAFGT